MFVIEYTNANGSCMPLSVVTSDADARETLRRIKDAYLLSNLKQVTFYESNRFLSIKYIACNNTKQVDYSYGWIDVGIDATLTSANIVIQFECKGD